jgi:hypothetical protein
MAEVDFISTTVINVLDTIDAKQVAQFYEINFLPMQGLNLKTTY